MLYAYSGAGVALPRVSRNQFNAGRKVPVSDLRPGDLVFYKRPGAPIHHVAMYIGGGQHGGGALHRRERARRAAAAGRPAPAGDATAAATLAPTVPARRPSEGVGPSGQRGPGEHAVRVDGLAQQAQPRAVARRPQRPGSARARRRSAARRRATTAATASTTRGDRRPTPPAHAGRRARPARTAQHVSAPRPATAAGTAAGRPSAPPSARSSTIVQRRWRRPVRGGEQRVDGRGGQLAQRRAAVVDRGRGRRLAVHGVGRGGRAARRPRRAAVSRPRASGRAGRRRRRRPTSAPAKRTCTTVRLCRGAGQRGVARARRSSATDVPASSGSVGAHSRQACSTSAAAAPGQTIPPP